MPISDIDSYVLTGKEFKRHWTEVNALHIDAAGTELSLPDEYSVENLERDVLSLQTSISVVSGLEKAVGMAINDRNSLKKNLRDRVKEFRQAVGLLLKKTGYEAALPATPAETSSEQKYLKAFDDMASLWARIDLETGAKSFSPPLVLRNDFALSAFKEDVATLRQLYKVVNVADSNLKYGRKCRDILLEPMRERFVEYRKAVNVTFGDSHPLFKSLPRVYPKSEMTGAPVVLTGSFINPPGEVHLTWTECSHPNVDHYSIRYSPGETYNPEIALQTGKLPVGVSSHKTDAGVHAPGDVASFKLFVVLTTNHEIESNAITISK